MCLPSCSSDMWTCALPSFAVRDLGRRGRRPLRGVRCGFAEKESRSKAVPRGLSRAPAPTMKRRKPSVGRIAPAPAFGLLRTVRGGGRKRPALRQMVTRCEFAEIRVIIGMYRRDVEDAVPYDGEVGTVRGRRGAARDGSRHCAGCRGRQPLRSTIQNRT